MKERQIEGAYRERLEGASRAAKSLEDQYDEAATNWALPDSAWIVCVARPRAAAVGLVPPTQQEARTMFERARKFGKVYSGASPHPSGVWDRYNPRPGLRRWAAPNASFSDALSWKASSASIHHDGAVSFAARVGGHRDSSTTNATNNVVAGSAIEAAVADFMGLVRAVSDQYGVGRYDVRVGIEWAGDDPVIMREFDTWGERYADAPLAVRRFAPSHLRSLRKRLLTSSSGRPTTLR